MTTPAFRLPGRDDRVPAAVLLDAAGLAGLRVRQACRELGLGCVLSSARREDADALVARALAMGCQALHPGESDIDRQLALAQACRRAGMTFAGPRTVLIEAMRDGHAIRQLMREAGVPLAERDDEAGCVELSVLADGDGRVRYLPVRHASRRGLTRAPAGWLTPEQRAYLGQLAVQGVGGLALVGLVTLRFRVEENRAGFVGMVPGLTGGESIDEALTGLDPVIEQLRLAAGERLREPQEGLRPRGYALQWRLFPAPDAAFSGGPGLRLDMAPEAGGEARLVAWGRRPEEALRRGRRGLEELLGTTGAAAMLADVAVP